MQGCCARCCLRCCTHRPANFFGIAAPDLLQQMEQQLAAFSSSSSCQRRPPVISFSHYPFSTITFSPGARQAGGGQLEGGRAVRDLLARYDVSAHLSGHLHDLVGPHMHTLHAKQSVSSSGSEAAADAGRPWEAAAGQADGAAAAAGAVGGAFLADLEVSPAAAGCWWWLTAVCCCCCARQRAGLVPPALQPRKLAPRLPPRCKATTDLPPPACPPPADG